MKTAAIILLAGSSSRFVSKTPKQFYLVKNKPLVYYTISSFQNCALVDEIVLVIRQEDKEKVSEIAKQFDKVSKIVVGGSSRQQSVYNGLVTLEKADNVLIHDGARPIVEEQIIKNLLRELLNGKAAIPVLREENSVVRIKNDKLVSYLNRDEIYEIQTPQAFGFDIVKKAHEKFKNLEFTDDAQLVMKLGEQIKIIPGSKSLKKVTTIEDIHFIESLLL